MSASTERAPKGRTGQRREVADRRHEVALRGRVSTAPEERTLPSGDHIVSVRLVLPRLASGGARDRTGGVGRGGGSGRRPGTDWVDCVGWTARTRRTIAAWQVDDEVEVSGALRRRFFRTGSGPATLVEIEVTGARRVSSRAGRA